MARGRAYIGRPGQTNVNAKLAKSQVQEILRVTHDDAWRYRPVDFFVDVLVRCVRLPVSLDLRVAALVTCVGGADVTPGDGIDQPR